MKIEELFKTRLQDHKMPVDNNLWDKLNTKMSTPKTYHQAKTSLFKSMSAAAKTVIAAVGSAAVIAAGIIIYNSVTENTGNTVANADYNTVEALNNDENTPQENVLTDDDTIVAVQKNKTAEKPNGLPDMYLEEADSFDGLPDSVNVIAPPVPFVTDTPSVLPALAVKSTKTSNENKISDSVKTVASNPQQLRKEDLGIDYPTVITPNHDGVNDCFVIKNIENYPDNELILFNRNGKPIYTKSYYNNEYCPWDLQQGTYFFTLKIRINGKTTQFNGSLTVLK